MLWIWATVGPPEFAKVAANLDVYVTLECFALIRLGYCGKIKAFRPRSSTSRKRAWDFSAFRGLPRKLHRTGSTLRFGSAQKSAIGLHHVPDCPGPFGGKHRQQAVHGHSGTSEERHAGKRDGSARSQLMGFDGLVIAARATSSI